MRHGLGMIRNESGATMMFVLMAMILVGAITVSAMQVIGADVGGGVEELEADQVFNIANAGVHYAIGKLQASGSTTYAGETRTITNGSTTLGTATIIVNCVDTTSVNNWTPPCASSAYPAYRRVISTGALPVSGPSRTIVAVVMGVSSGGTASSLCSLSTVTSTPTSPDSIKIYSDIAANGAVTMSGPVSVLGGTGFTGKVTSNSTVSCTTGCSIAGGSTQNVAGTLCTAPTMPTFPAAGSAVSVASGGVFIVPSTGGNYGAVTLADGLCPGSPWYTDFQINTGAAGTTTTVSMSTLTMGKCGRLVINGAGNVNLLVGAASGQSITLNGSHATSNNWRDHIGAVYGVDNQTTATLVPATQLTVYVKSTTTTAAYFGNVAESGTFIIPNGAVTLDDNQPESTGAFVAKGMTFSSNTTYHNDTTGLAKLYAPTSFSMLNSWKDQ